MSLPYLAIIEVGQLLDATALLRLRLVDKHWNYLFTQLYFQNLAFRQPLGARDLAMLKKYDGFVNALHIDRFDENMASLMRLTRTQKLPYLTEFSTSLPTNLHAKYMADLVSFCKTLAMLKHLRIFRITAESGPQQWRFARLHSLSLEMDGCWDVLSFLQNLVCPDLRVLTIVHSRPRSDLAARVQELFPGLDEFHVLPYLEAKTHSLSVNYRAKSVSAVAINAEESHSAFIAFNRPQHEFDTRTRQKREAIATLQGVRDTFAEHKRIGQIRSYLPYIDTFHFGHFKSTSYLYELFRVLQGVRHLEFDWRIMPLLTDPASFRAKQLTFHSQCGLYRHDMEWFINSFPDLESLHLTHCYGERHWEGSFPKLTHLVCLYASAAPLQMLLRTAPNCRHVAIARNYYEILHAEGFFARYPMVDFQIHQGGIFESGPLFQ